MSPKQHDADSKAPSDRTPATSVVEIEPADLFDGAGHGQILFRHRAEIPGRIEQLQATAHGRRTHVVVESCSRCSQLAHTLRFLFDVPIAIAGMKCVDKHPKVIVYDLMAIDHRDIAPGELLIVVGDRTALSLWDRWGEGYSPTRRMYCLRSAAYELPYYAPARLRSMYGEILAGLPPRPPRVRVRQMFFAAQSGSPGRKGLIRKMRRIWHCDLRNDWIAEIAQAFSVMNAEALNRLNLSGDCHPAWTTSNPPQVAILVETPAHGQALQRRLADSVLVTRIPNRLGEDEIELSWPSPYAIKIISFMAAQQSIHADVILRVDNTSTPWCWKLGPADEHLQGVLVIDLTDLRNDAPANKSNQSKTKRAKNVCATDFIADPQTKPVDMAQMIDSHDHPLAIQARERQAQYHHLNWQVEPELILLPPSQPSNGPRRLAKARRPKGPQQPMDNSATHGTSDIGTSKLHGKPTTKKGRLGDTRGNPTDRIATSRRKKG